MLRKGKQGANTLVKARIEAEVSEAGEGLSDGEIIEQFETSASMVYRVRSKDVPTGALHEGWPKAGGHSRSSQKLPRPWFPCGKLLSFSSVSLDRSSFGIISQAKPITGERTPWKP